jgi:hypothetical protein
MRRIVAWLSLGTYSLALGCSSVREVPISESLDSQERVVAVVYPSGKVVYFDDRGGILNSYRGTIDGVDRHGAPLSIKIDDTLHVRIRQTDTTKTILYTLTGVGIVVAIGAIIVHNVTIWE